MVEHGGPTHRAHPALQRLARDVETLPAGQDKLGAVLGGKWGKLR